jgi:hypothetical protein
VTHGDIAYARRVRLLEFAARCGNVTHACEVFGVSRKTYYQWLDAAAVAGRPLSHQRRPMTCQGGQFPNEPDARGSTFSRR